MKKDAFIYWTATGIVCSIMTFSAINFSLGQPLAPGGESFSHLGYPSYFQVELSIAKILGVLALLIPAAPATLKEFAYFGFGITLISASIAHFSCSDGIIFVFGPLFFLGILLISYAYFRKASPRQGLSRSA